MLTRYLLKEILANFILVLFLAIFLLFLTKIVDFGPEILERGGNLTDLARFSVYLLFFLLPFSLPLAALAGTLLAFMRLAHDQELLAFSSLGIPPRRLLRPVLYFAGGVFLLVFLINVLILPLAKRQMRDALFEVFKRRLERGIPERSPVDWFPGFVLYVHKVKQGFFFEDFYLLDESQHQKIGLIYAPKGELRLNKNEAVLYLEKGEGHFVSRDLSEAENFYFGTYKYRFPLTHWWKKREFKRGELDLKTVWKRGHDPRLPSRQRRKYISEFYQRLFYPFSALVLPLLGLPLGARLRASGRGLALTAGLLLYLFYYLLFSLGTTLSEEGNLSPPLALAIPNLVFLTLAGFLLKDFERIEGR